ncbi:unnamed protein product [Diamesa serratosioi]
MNNQRSERSPNDLLDVTTLNGNRCNILEELGIDITNEQYNEIKMLRLENDLWKLKRESEKVKAENKKMKKINESNIYADESDVLSANLYSWITSLVGQDKSYIEQDELLNDDEIIMIDCQVVGPPIAVELRDLFGDFYPKTQDNSSAQWFRGIIISSDDDMLQIRNVEFGDIYCFKKSKDTKHLPTKQSTFKYLGIPCALVTQTELFFTSSILILLKKYTNFKTQLSFELDIKMYYDENTYLFRRNTKKLECKPAGNCRISYIKSTAEFYIQLEADFKKLRSICKILKRIKVVEAFRVQPRHMYVVLHPYNNKLYRAKIIRIDERGIKAKLIDYGNNVFAKKVFSTSHYMIEHFLAIPPIARKCCLRTSPTLSPQAERKFEAMQLIKGGILMAVNMYQMGSFQLVELFHRSFNNADDLMTSQTKDYPKTSDPDSSIVCFNNAFDSISSQTEDHRKTSDADISINAYSYRASMDDYEFTNQHIS